MATLVTAADALAAANAAATTVTAVGNRIDAVELPFTNIAAQVQTLITAATAVGGSAGGGGGGGGGLGPAGPVPSLYQQLDAVSTRLD